MRWIRRRAGVSSYMNPSAAPDPRRWRALALLCTAFFMVILDSAIVIVAIPSIEHDLGFSQDGLQWVLSAYALAFGGLLLLGGRAADLLGRRRVFLAGTLLFTLASLSCGLAWSGPALIAARAVQGIGAAAMTPSALSILMTTFPEGAERNRALGIWSSLGGIGASAGWLIGGPLTDGPGWEWVFFINVPVGVAVLAIGPRLLRESRERERVTSFDPGGALAVTAAFLLLVYAIVEAPTAGWGSAQTIALLAGSGALFAVFATIESRVRSPLVPLRLLRSRRLVGANLAMLVIAAVAFGMPFILTQYAQQVLGYSAVKFGLTSLVFPLLASAGSIAGQAIVTKRGFTGVAAVGLALAAAACALLTGVSVGGTYLGDIFPALVVFGAGLGLTFVASSIAALSGVAESESGLASGLNNTAFQLGGALGVAVATTVAVSSTSGYVASHGGADRLVALTEGFQSAFLACVAFPLAGLALTLVLFGLRRRPAVPEAERAVAAGQ
jgi:EmrB/QacA subfamily drug resistance transporter